MKSKSVPKDAVEIYNKALELSNKGTYTEAISEYKKAIKIHPKFIEAFNNIGEIYSQMGESNSAMSAYMDALNINRDQKVLLNIGVEQYNKKDYKAALDYFIESISSDDSFIEGNFYTALTYYNLNDMKLSENFFIKVLIIDKKHIKSNYLLSTIYYEKKEYKKTLVCLDNIKDIYEDKIFINKYYGFCCYFLGRYEEAIDYLTDALKSQPNYHKYKDFLGRLNYENKIKEIGNIDEEIKDLEKKISKEKTNINELTKLSMLYIFKGKNKRAEKLLLEAREKLAS